MRPIALAVCCVALPALVAARGNVQPEDVGGSLLTTPVTAGGSCRLRDPGAATRALGVERVVSYTPEGSAPRITVQVDAQRRVRYLAAVDTVLAPSRRREGGPTRVAATFTAAGTVARGAWWDAPLHDDGVEQHRAFAATDTADARRLAAAVIARCGG